MKVLFLTVSIPFFPLISNSQILWGFKTSAGLSSIAFETHGNPPDNPIKPTGHHYGTHFSYNVGMTIMVKLAEHFSLQPSLQWTKLGAITTWDYAGHFSNVDDYENYKRKTSYHYLQLPVLLSIQTRLDHQFTVGFGIGPYIGYYLGGKQTQYFEDDLQYKDGNPSYVDRDYFVYKIKASSTDLDPQRHSTPAIYVKPWELGISIAPFFMVEKGGPKLQISPTFQWGFTRVNAIDKGATFYSKETNWQMALSFALLFGQID